MPISLTNTGHIIPRYSWSTRQSNHCGFSIYIFDNSKSKTMVRLVRAEKMVLSGLVFARKIARMILIQNIQGLMGPLMFNMAFMPLYMWEMWDVTPVTDTRTDGRKRFCGFFSRMLTLPLRNSTAIHFIVTFNKLWTKNHHSKRIVLIKLKSLFIWGVTESPAKALNEWTKGGKSKLIVKYQCRPRLWTLQTFPKLSFGQDFHQS